MSSTRSPCRPAQLMTTLARSTAVAAEGVSSDAARSPRPGAGTSSRPAALRPLCRAAHGRTVTAHAPASASYRVLETSVASRISAPSRRALSAYETATSQGSTTASRGQSTAPRAACERAGSYARSSAADRKRASASPASTFSARTAGKLASSSSVHATTREPHFLTCSYDRPKDRISSGWRWMLRRSNFRSRLPTGAS